MPTTIGSYSVVREVGVGATSNVYLVTSPTGSPYALKLMRADRDNKVSRRMFATEAALCGKLHHPNIATLLESGEDRNGLPYIVMEFVDGDALDSFATQGATLPDEMVIDIIRQSAEALDYACKQGIIHRDLKPANIMLRSEDGQVKLTDFGCAVVHDTESTQLGIVGTANFMSPEQVLGQTVNYQSDIFSLGSVMYRLLTGRPAFLGSSYQSLAAKIIKSPHTPMKVLREDVNESFAPIVDKAMRKKPEDRYQSWDEFLYDLHNLSQSIRASDKNISHSDKFMAMRASPFFERFSDIAIKELMPLITWRTFHDKEVIASEGLRGHSFFVLLAGRVHTTRKAKSIDNVNVGGCVGESAYLSGGFDLRRETATAQGAVTALEISVTQMRNLSSRCRMALDQAILKDLGMKLSAAYDKLAPT